MRTEKTLHKSGTQSSDDPFTFIMSSEKVDRTGDVIRADGWDLKNFKKNPIALFGHQHSFPIGTWKNVRVEGKKLFGDLVLAAEGTSERIDEIRSLISQRILKAVSVGFRVLDYNPIDKNEPWGGWDITQSELLETSVVSVPAHQDALAAAKSLGISKETIALAFGTGKNATSIHRERSSTTTSPKDYSEILGDPSDVVRRRNELRSQGLIP